MKVPPKTNWNKNDYFFNSGIYPAKWDKYSDAKLVELFKKLLKKNPNSSERLLIVCYLMTRHQDAILAISFRYLKNKEEVRDLTHDLFEKLKKAFEEKEILSFGGLVVITTKRMCLDIIKKRKITISDDVLSLNGKSTEDELNFLIDNPLSREKLQLLFQEKVLSKMEQVCIEMRVIDEMKPGEITDEISPEILNMKPKASDMSEKEYYIQKRKKVFGAIERGLRKLRNYLRP